MPPKDVRPIAQNRKARHDYSIIETFECGVMLTGAEVKSLRGGKAQLRDSFARVTDGEAWLHGVHIPPYGPAAGHGTQEPERVRKLLLHRRQLDELGERTSRESLTLVPLSIYFANGKAKVELALARGRRRYDKRDAIAARDSARDVEREMKLRHRK